MGDGQWAAAPEQPANIKNLSPLEEECKQLSKENRRLKVQAARQRLRWKNEKEVLRKRLRAAERKASKLDKLMRLGILTDRQVTRAVSGRRVNWTSNDISRALGLRCRSRGAYVYAKTVLRLPLPSETTLARWTRAFRVTPGVMEAAVTVLEPAVREMNDLQRLCVISFDEMSLDGSLCYDAAADQILEGSKLQLLMVRGLCDSWKQPLFYELDSPMKKETLDSIIVLLESMGLRVVAAVSDMGFENESLWTKAGITNDQTWFTNPADVNR